MKDNYNVVLSDQTEYDFSKKEFFEFLENYHVFKAYKPIEELFCNNEIEEYFYVAFFEYQGRDIANYFDLSENSYPKPF